MNLSIKNWKKLQEKVQTVNGDEEESVPSGDVQSVLAYASTVNVDFSLVDTVHTLALTGNVTLTTSNKQAAKSKTIIITNGGTIRTLTFPVGWVWQDQVAPSSLGANKRAFLHLYCQGTTEADVTAFYSVQP